MKIALMNGANEIELPWYTRAEYSNNLGYWNVDKYVFTTKLEVVFPAAPEAEFLDYRESSNAQQPVNGWVLWPSAPCGPIFYGQLAEALPIYIDRAMAVSFYVALDMSNMSHGARNAALHVLFDEPQRAGHIKGLASLLEATRKEMRRAPAYNMGMDNAEAYRVLQGTKSTAS